ncbi:MAG: hypothetical protein WBW51_13070 [Methyloceanibacter sp.]
MQASEAFTGVVVVGAGSAGLRARARPDGTLGFRHTTASRLTPRILLRVA